MSVMSCAKPIAGWNMTWEITPAIGAEVEIMHFGNSEKPIYDTATVDEWGIRPHAKDGGHGKRSTVTHWRPIETAAPDGPMVR